MISVSLSALRKQWDVFEAALSASEIADAQEALTDSLLWGQSWGDSVLPALLDAVEAAQDVVDAHVAIIEGVTPKHPNWCADDRDEYDPRFSAWHAATRRLRDALARFRASGGGGAG